MRILITGATGSMAYYLAQYIKTQVKDRHEICGIGRRRVATIAAATYLDQYDALDLYWHPTSRVTEYISEIKPDLIFHLAAMANVRQSFSEPRKFFANNSEGTLNLLDGIARAGFKPRIVLASTSEVYGNVPVESNPIVESEEFNPVNYYAASKCAQEILASVYANTSGLEFVVTRAFGYINPRRDDLVATALAKQIVKFERGEIQTVYHGNLKPVRSFCDARDIAEAYWLAAIKCQPGVYNIGSETPFSIGSLVTALHHISESDPKFAPQEDLLRKTDIFACWPDITKFANATGWRPKIELADSLKWLMECVRK